MDAQHPVGFHVEPPPPARDRVTVAFRPLLALPHLLLVGGPTAPFGPSGLHIGAFGAFAAAIALLDWFAIVFTGAPLQGLARWKVTYLEWRARALAYTTLLRDEYPPFGEGPYPARLIFAGEAAPRDRLTVGLRPLLLIPHALVLALLLVAWLVAALVSWCEFLVTGALSPGLWRFGRDVMAYVLRVEAYLLLVHDQFPPFALDVPAPAAAGA